MTPTTNPAVLYLLLRLGEAWEINAADTRVAKTAEEKAFANGQRQLLHSFNAWVEVAATGSHLRYKQGKLV